MNNELNKKKQKNKIKKKNILYYYIYSFKVKNVKNNYYF